MKRLSDYLNNWKDKIYAAHKESYYLTFIPNSKLLILKEFLRKKTSKEQENECINILRFINSSISDYSDIAEDLEIFRRIDQGKEDLLQLVSNGLEMLLSS